MADTSWQAPRMAINASDWCDDFYIFWANDEKPSGFVDAGYRLKGQTLFLAKLNQ